MKKDGRSGEYNSSSCDGGTSDIVIIKNDVNDGNDDVDDGKLKLKYVFLDFSLEFLIE